MVELKEIRGKVKRRHYDFWLRKKEEIRQQQRLAGMEDRVTNDTMLQGLIDLWMRLEERGHRQSDKLST